MILNGCTRPPGVGCAFPRTSTSKPGSGTPVCSSISGLSTRVPSSSFPFQLLKSKLCSSRGLSAGSTPLLSGDEGGIWHTLPSLPRKPRSNLCPRAFKDLPTSFRYPPMTKKPEFWWRILACIPYLMPLHETWMYAETAYSLHPFIESLEFVTHPFLAALGTLPRWFLIVYFIVGYLAIVRRKEWPHFFRFHVVQGMLLEIGLQAVGISSRWIPEAIYFGAIGMHVWAVIAFGHLFTVMECIRCCLRGMYADVPFASDAAYIQIPYEN